MIILGYEGMPRRYATYQATVGPIELFTLMHQLATVGALVLTVGQLIFVWNLVQSWLEGPEVDDGDPWDLDEYGQRTREWDWFGRKQETALPDGGSGSDASGTSSEVRSDGGSGSDASGSAGSENQPAE